MCLVHAIENFIKYEIDEFDFWAVQLYHRVSIKNILSAIKQIYDNQNGR